MDVKMEVDKMFASLGEQLSYKVTLTNKQQVQVEEIIVVNYLGETLQFIEGTLKVDGEWVSGNLEYGVPIGILEQETARSLTFKAEVIELPLVNPIIHITDTYFRERGGSVTKEQASNTTMTVITDPNIRPEAGSFNLKVDKEAASSRGILTYTIEIINKGNCKAERIYISNLVPKGTKLRGENIEIEGVEYIEAYLEIGESKCITYQVEIDSSQKQYEIIHQVFIEYEFIFPNRKRVSKKYWSNSVCTRVYQADFNASLGGFTKSISQNKYTLEDYLEYKLSLTNIGNIEADYIRVIDELPKGINFVQGSLKVNGSNYTANKWPYEGIVLNQIKSGENIVIEYIAQVKEISYEYQQTKANIYYEYTVEQEVIANEECSNTLANEIFVACLQNEKFKIEANKERVTLQECIEYKLNVVNTGNISAYIVKIVADKPQGLLVLEEIWQEETDRAYIECEMKLMPGETYEIPYTLQVEDIIEGNTVNIGMTLYYFYEIDGRIIEREVYGRQEAETVIRLANLDVECGGFLKEVDQTDVQVGEELNYTIYLSNKGNVKAQDISLYEELPSEVEIIKESLQIDEGYINWNEENEIYVGAIEVGEIRVICYKTRVVAIPKEDGWVRPFSHLKYTYEVDTHRDVNRIYEGICTKVTAAIIDTEDGGIIRTVDEHVVSIGERIEYTTVITNTGNIVARDVRLRRMIENIYVLGVEDFIEIGDVEPQESKVINYDLVVDNLPESAQIISIDYIEYTYQVGKKEIKRMVESNPIITWVQEARLAANGQNIYQKVDKQAAKIGDQLTYTVYLENDGNADAEEVILELPPIDGARWLNDNLIKIDKIAIGENYCIDYKLEIIDLPKDGKVVCNPIIEYKFELSNGEARKRVYSIETIETPIYIAWLTTREGFMQAQLSSKYVTVGEEIIYTVEFINQGNIEAQEIYWKPAIPKETEWIPNAFEINGEIIEYDNTEHLIHLKNIGPSETIKISYGLKVMQIPREGIINLPTELSYQYSINQGEFFEQVIVVEQVEASEIKVRTAVVLLDKQVDKLEITNNERIKYHLHCINVGNIQAWQVKIKQILPRGMRMCQETLMIEDTVPIHLVNKEELNIGNLQPGQEINIRFEVEVEEWVKEETLIDYTEAVYGVEVIPTEPVQIQHVPVIQTTFNIINPKVKGEIIVAQELAVVGDKVPCRLQLINQGNIGIKHLTLEEITFSGKIEIIPNSIKVESNKQYEALEQVKWDYLEIQEQVDVEFEIYVKERIPDSKLILQPNIRYEFDLRESSKQYVEKGKCTQILVEEVSVAVDIKSDKDGMKVKLDDEINYIIEVANTGTLKVIQVVLYNYLSEQVTLVDKNFRIGESDINIGDLREGINLGEIGPGQKIFIEYKVRVDYYYSKIITNTIYLEYNVKEDEYNYLNRFNRSPLNHEIKLVSPKLANLEYRNVLTLPYQCPDVYQIIELEVTHTIISQEILETSSDILWLRGQLKYGLTYMGRDKIKYSMEWIKLFLEKIEIAKLIHKQDLEVEMQIEKQYSGIINTRQIETLIELGIREG